MRHRSRFALDIVHLIVATALFAGCEHQIVDPPLPAGAVQFSPPPVYARWWAETQACSRHTADLSGITWQLVPHVSEFQLNNQTVSGYWTEGRNSIVIAEGVRLDGSVIRHEMLHALTRTSGHARVDFLDNCGGVVSCTLDCIRDAGTPPSIGPSLPVSPDSLEVSVSLVPDAPSSAVDSGVFTLIVSVHNRATYPIVGGNIGSTSYTFDIRGAFGGPARRIQGTRPLLDPSAILFAARETKRQYFDFQIGPLFGPTTIGFGTYAFAGAYGSRSAVLTPVPIGSQ